MNPLKIHQYHHYPTKINPYPHGPHIQIPPSIPMGPTSSNSESQHFQISKSKHKIFHFPRKHRLISIAPPNLNSHEKTRRNVSYVIHCHPLIKRHVLPCFSHCLAVTNFILFPPILIFKIK